MVMLYMEKQLFSKLNLCFLIPEVNFSSSGFTLIKLGLHKMKNKHFVFTLYLMSLMKEFILKCILGSRQSNRIDQLSAGREGTVVRNTAMSKFQEI